MLMLPLSVKFPGASCMHALRLETVELPKTRRKFFISTIHLKWIIWELYVKKEIILHWGQKTIASQLLRYWNTVLGAIDLHSINNLNEGLHMGTG